jgi:hypothetical protein
MGDETKGSTTPADCYINHLDTTEVSIIFLGFVFDASSLGKWIYDWTVYHHDNSDSRSL